MVSLQVANEADKKATSGPLKFSSRRCTHATTVGLKWIAGGLCFSGRNDER
jgi:hypothetical protein